MSHRAGVPRIACAAVALTFLLSFGCQTASRVDSAPAAKPQTQPAPRDAAGSMAQDDAARAEATLDEQNAEKAGKPQPSNNRPADYRRGNRVVDQPQVSPRRP